MRLSRLLERADVLHRGPGDPEIERVVADSRHVGPGDLFVAVRGLSVDGHAFVATAFEQGAAAALVEAPAQLPPERAGAVVASTPAALAFAAGAHRGEPTRSFSLIGVTGTNGKTTTTYLVEAILLEAGATPGVVGTVGYRFGGETRAAPFTTPDPVALQDLFAEMFEAGVSHVIMEASSHALEQRRVEGCHFQVAAFSNLTQDHLDYHGSMDAYFGAKLRLFTELLPASAAPGRTAVVSLDDRRGPDIVAACQTPVLTFSTARSDADLRVREVSYSPEGIAATLVTPAGSIRIESPLVGSYNLENLLCAVGIAAALGITPDTIASALSSCRGAPGRLERIDNDQGIGVFVDYAHTSDALDRVLAAVRQHTTGRLIAVFGCGGDRDRGKRPLMGAAAARNADLVVVTSDNPRTEDPDNIIEMILPGVRGTGLPEVASTDFPSASGRAFAVQADRRSAIRLAISAAHSGDSVVIAGKGHEDYQILGSERIHFDDREEAAAALAEVR